MKTALFLLIITLSPTLAHTQDCPEGYKCVTDAAAKEMAEVLDLHNCMVDLAESGNLDLDWQPNDIVITDKGQVFAQKDMIATLNWCTWHLEFRGKTKVIVTRKTQEEPAWGFRLRIKLGITFLPTRLLEEVRFTDTLDPTLLAEPFFFHDFHVQVHAGLRTFGVGLGLDLTKNADLFIAVGLDYRNAEVLPILGASLSFN